jgi:anti-sigma factor RsiW
MTVDHQSALNRSLTELYVLGELEASEAAEFEEHFFECPLCAEDVRRASLLVANVKAVLREEDDLP